MFAEIDGHTAEAKRVSEKAVFWVPAAFDSISARGLHGFGPKTTGQGFPQG